MTTAKDSCPKCKTRFRVGALPTHDDLRRMVKQGVINLGEPAPEKMNCPTCSAPLKVVSVRMGTYFSTVD